MRPRELTVNDSDTNSTNSVVAAWADGNSNNLILQQPSVFPTPYNPAPFPNLPSGTKHARTVYLTVIGMTRSTATPAVLRAISVIGYVPCQKNGTHGTT